MAGYTYPTPRSTGYVMGASTWNAEVVDNLRWLGSDAPSCKAIVSGVQSIPVGVPTFVGFDAEWWDTANMHSVAVNNSRFVAPVTGRYEVCAYIRFQVGAGVYNAFIEPYSNGFPTQDRAGMAFNAVDCGMNVINEYPLTAGDYIEIAAWHNNGVAVNVFGSCIVKWVGR